MGMDFFYILDIDGVLADPNKRVDAFLLDERGARLPKPDWGRFFERDAVLSDEPIRPMCELAFRLWRPRTSFGFLTGRPERTRDATAEWLYEHTGIDEDYDEPSFLMMRPDNVRIDDDVLKPMLLNRYRPEARPENTVLFDDRIRIVKAWHALGYNCLTPNLKEF